jgi:hypothetical protein
MKEYLIRVPGVDPEEIATMSWPAQCRHCRHIHDAGTVEVVQRYTDCSVWQCPKCKVQIDDRAYSWGGSINGPELKRRIAGGLL